MALHFRIPSHVKILGKRVKTWQLVLATGGLAVGVFALHHKYMDPPLVKKAHKIVTQLNPPQLDPKRPSLLTGHFEDKDGHPVRVKMGRYALIMNQGNKQIPITGGLIGPYAFEFQVQVQVPPGAPPGQYFIRVDDNLAGE